MSSRCTGYAPAMLALVVSACTYDYEALRASTAAPSPDARPTSDVLLSRFDTVLGTPLDVQSSPPDVMPPDVQPSLPDVMPPPDVVEVGCPVQPVVRARVTTSFQDRVSPTASYSGTRDTWLDGINITTNHGTGGIYNTLELDTNMSAIVKWDTSTIPAGSIVTAASITVHVFNPSSAVYEVYEMLRNWVETQATWNVYATGSSWATAGAQGLGTDRGTTVLGTITGTFGVQTVTLNASGVALVHKWVDDPAGNFGVIFQDYVNIDGLDFRSREQTVPSERPILTVTYTPSQGSSCVGAP